MKLKIIYFVIVLGCAAAVFGQPATTIVTAPNGLTYELKGRDATRGADQIWYYTTAFYKKTPPNNAGVDVYVVDDKIVEINDRAGAVFLSNKPDPGAIKVSDKGYVLSANGAARRWLLANFKIGDAVKIGARSAATAEVAPAKTLPCFAGAYYRKAVSSFDAWTGIAGFVKLGTPQVDENRIGEKTKQPLDNFSVYMGGNAGGEHEVDAGLSWEFTLDEAGKKSERRNAFRPFWRTKTWNSAPAQKEFYFYPGETVQMAVLIAGPNRLRLIVSDGKSKTFQTEFDAVGFAPNTPRQFKRVNAIDQVANEGKPAQKTAAQITGAQWLSTILLRGAGAEATQIPMTAEKFTDMRCPNVDNIVVTETDRAKGGEKIDIFGTPKN